MAAVVTFLFRNVRWKRLGIVVDTLGLLAVTLWTAFGAIYWGLVDWQSLVAILLLVVWVVATLALPKRPRRGES